MKPQRDFQLTASDGLAKQAYPPVSYSQTPDKGVRAAQLVPT